jgi:GNAT superfamily N-acetyltransferase
MAVALTEEISDALGAKLFDLGLEQSTEVCRALLAEGRYLVLIAEMDGKPVGFAGLSEGRALYAGGAMATLQEFYVDRSCRSRGIGAKLVQAAVELAREKGWHRLEVCTPPLPQFDRTLAFYERNGFEITGGRKLKRLIPVP